VVDIVNEVSQIENGCMPFYGLYNDTLPKRCWLNDDKTILLSTPQGCSMHPFAIDTGNNFTLLFLNNLQTVFLVCLLKSNNYLYFGSFGFIYSYDICFLA